MPENVAYWEIDEVTGEVKHGGHSMNSEGTHTNWEDD